MKKNLQTIYLRVDSSSRSLTKRALAQLVLKIVYSYNKPTSSDDISKELKVILGTNLSNEKINEAFEILLNDGKISKEADNRFSITPTKKNKIDEAVTEFENRQKRILEKYFGPIKTPPNAILQWFEEVTIEFFNEYSSEWIADLCVNAVGIVKNRHQNIRTILDSVTSKNANILEKDKDWLKKAYIKFLQSSDNDVASLLWDYGTSRFSSSLIVANTAADPITIDEFKDSKCILDTNILMYLDLEKGNFSESFKSMEKVFLNLNISPVYFFCTRDEFSRTLEHKKNDIVRVVDNYPIDVVTASTDPFLHTAVHRGCSTASDFEEFFNQLMDIPKFFSETLEIKMEDNPELDVAITNGQKNQQLKDKINAIYKKKRHINKKKNALLHDAGLISGAEHNRKEEKCFILSRDSSINEVALESPVKNEMPIAVGLNTLINLLAIDNGGTDIDPTNCAPLFANIIKLALIPERDIFKPEDLSRMLDIEMQIGQLPSEDIIDIAKEFHHNTIIGLNEDETSLQLNRRFQKAKLELKSDLDEAKKGVHLEKEEKERQIRRSDRAVQKLREQYAGELMDKYDAERRRNRLVIFLIFPFVTTIITLWIIYAANKELQESWAQYVIGIALNIVAWALTDFLYLDKKIISKHSERVIGINSQVEIRIRQELEE